MDRIENEKVMEGTQTHIQRGDLISLLFQNEESRLMNMGSGRRPDLRQPHFTSCFMYLVTFERGTTARDLQHLHTWTAT
jgi:hypothetical protein